MNSGNWSAKLFEYAPFGIIILSNKSSKAVTCNNKAEEYFGYSSEELCSLEISVLTHPDDLGVSTAKMKDLREGLISQFSLQKRYLTKSGKVVWANTRCFSMRDPIGDEVYYIVNIEEITSKKAEEASAEGHERRMELAIDGTNDGVWDWIDLSQKEEWWSPRYYELLGYKVGEIEANVDIFSDELLHPDDVDDLWVSFEKCLNEGCPMDNEYRLKTKSGEYKWFRGRGNTSYNEEGKAIRMTGSISDIHERKILEIKLKETDKFLREVTQIVPSTIYVFSHKTMSNEYSNREIGTMLGYSNQEIEEIGTQFVLKICHPEDLPKIYGHFKKVKNLKKDEFAQIEYRIMNQNGKYIWLLSADTVFERDSNGLVTKHIGIATNISKIKLFESKLLYQSTALSEKNEELEQLAYVATHDLKVPILNIEGHFNYLKNFMPKDNAMVIESANFLEQGVKEFKMKIEGLTKALRIQNTNDQIRSINIQEILLHKLKVFENDLKRIGGEIVIYAEEEDSFVVGSEIFIQSIIQNVLSNSLKYASPERPLKVLCTIRTNDKFVELQVADNGIGFDSEFQKEKLYGMFNRFHDHVEGSGMGLYMVKKMTENIGGSVHVTSIVDQGTQVTLKFKKGENVK